MVCQITKRNIQASFVVSMVDFASTVHIDNLFGAMLRIHLAIESESGKLRSERPQSVTIGCDNRPTQ